MRFYLLTFCILLPFSAYAVDFPDSKPQNAGVIKLSAASFPETKFDTTFTERVESMYTGYAPFETIWDEKGNCISGCAYSGMTVETEERRLERDSEIIQKKLDIYCTQNPGKCPKKTISDKVDKTAKPTSYTHNCFPSNPLTPANQKIPISEPLAGFPRISSGCSTMRHIKSLDYPPHPHIALDFSAVVGTPVYAPADGIVLSVFKNHKTCGNGITLQHADGFTTGYCHLSDVSMVTKGQSVSAGCMFARTGNTGLSTGPHLHYVIKLNGSPVCPNQFISR